MKRPESLDHQRFGRWVVSHHAPGARMSECICDCGTVKSVAAYDLRAGKTKSCGCGRKGSFTWHGMSVEDRFTDKFIPEPNSGCWLWTASICTDGYGSFFDGQTIGHAHRYSYKLHCGPCGELHVCHRCDTPQCVNPDHLFLGTNYENVLDKIAKGRQARVHGELSGMSKLTEAQVLAIRADCRTYLEISAYYGVNPSCIGSIKRRVTWQHLP